MKIITGIGNEKWGELNGKDKEQRNGQMWSSQGDIFTKQSQNDLINLKKKHGLVGKEDISSSGS